MRLSGHRVGDEGGLEFGRGDEPERRVTALRVVPEDVRDDGGVRLVSSDGEWKTLDDTAMENAFGRVQTPPRTASMENTRHRFAAAVVR